MELCNGTDDDCDGEADEDFDADGDGAPACPDCDDCPGQDCAPDDPDIHPGARDVCEDGVDQNCDGRDTSCDAPAGRISRASISDANGAGCRDFNGDDRPDNALALAAGLANDQLQQAINTFEINLVFLTIGLVAPTDTGVFDLGMVVAERRAGVEFDLDPVSVNDEGQPRVLLAGANADEGALTAGPGDFAFVVPFNNVNLDLRISQALLTGDLDVQAPGVTIEDGWITGVVLEDDLQALVALLPPDIQPLVAVILTPDVDSDADGEADAYSICLTFEVTPVTLHGFPPAD